MKKDQFLQIYCPVEVSGEKRSCQKLVKSFFHQKTTRTNNSPQDGTELYDLQRIDGASFFRTHFSEISRG